MNVTGSTFSEEDFSKKDLVGSVFNKCNFYRCNFNRTDLTDVKFHNCRFIEAGDIDGCSFEYAQLKDASFKESDLSMAQFTGRSLFRH